MDRLITMIERYAETAGIAAEKAAEHIVAAHAAEAAWTFWIVLVGTLGTVFAFVMVVRHTFSLKIDDDGEGKTSAFVVISGVLGILSVILVLILMFDFGNMYAAYQEPAGHLMKKYLMK